MRISLLRLLDLTVLEQQSKIEDKIVSWLL
jgi:hypothetical protein